MTSFNVRFFGATERPAIYILTAQHDNAVIKLANAEIQIEDLKLQLDDALGAEDMVVQLTERNLMLGEVSVICMVFRPLSNNVSSFQKIEDMRITIEDLEALKELSDELEENHVETEKALHEDLGQSCNSDVNPR